MNLRNVRVEEARTYLEDKYFFERIDERMSSLEKLSLHQQRGTIQANGETKGRD